MTAVFLPEGVVAWFQHFAWAQNSQNIRKEMKIKIQLKVEVIFHFQ
jgi:hypothetical protein